MSASNRRKRRGASRGGASSPWVCTGSFTRRNGTRLRRKIALEMAMRSQIEPVPRGVVRIPTTREAGLPTYSGTRMAGSVRGLPAKRPAPASWGRSQPADWQVVMSLTRNGEPPGRVTKVGSRMLMPTNVVATRKPTSSVPSRESEVVSILPHSPAGGSATRKEDSGSLLPRLDSTVYPGYHGRTTRPRRA
jgi:hypothetical protein